MHIYLQANRAAEIAAAQQSIQAAAEAAASDSAVVVCGYEWRQTHSVAWAAKAVRLDNTVTADELRAGLRDGSLTFLGYGYTAELAAAYPLNGGSLDGFAAVELDEYGRPQIYRHAGSGALVIRDGLNGINGRGVTVADPRSRVARPSPPEYLKRTLDAAREQYRRGSPRD